VEQLSPENKSEMEPPLLFCLRHIRAFEKKADHNKQESLRCFVVIIASTLAAPVFVMLGSEWILGKLVPSCLSLLAAAATAWLQLRKPQQLWAMYRDAQRKLEDHKNRFHYKLPPYSEQQFPETFLAAQVADVALEVHYKWMPLVPSPDHLAQLKPSHEQLALTASDKKDGQRI
jgi:SMODS and SLOG-associating 2TM effector domain 1